MADNIAQPGQTVTPSSQQPAAEPPAQPTQPEPPAAPPEPSAPDPAPQEPVPQTPAPEAPSEEEPSAPVEQQPESDQVGQGFDPTPIEGEPETPDTTQPISWTASEFINHHKSAGWYAALAFGAAVFAALIFLLTRDVVSTGVIIVAALVFGIYAGHKPRELEYRLDGRGLSIGQKHFTYDQFRSFSVLPEGAFSSIVFMPLRRFAVPTTIYYAPEDENKIVSLLGGRLPLEEHGHDAVDRLMHRIHF